MAALPVNLQEILLEISTDRGLQLKLSGVSLTEFWTFVKQEHPDLGDEALEHLLPFASTYLCEVTFFFIRASASQLVDLGFVP